MELDARIDDDVYERFYEELGNKYPESEIAHQSPWAKRRNNEILHYLKPFAKSGKYLLDVGCGEGTYSLAYCRLGGRAHGIDISKSLINKAMQNVKHEKVKRIMFSVADAQKLKKLEKTYDIILMAEVLEHLNHPDEALTNLSRMLKRGGYLLLTTPTPTCEGAEFDLRYVFDVMFSKKLIFDHTVDSQQTILNDYGISPIKYRHDGYYPLQLKNYIKKFGFSCEFFYTIGGIEPIIKGFLTRAPPLMLRLCKPISLLGIINIQMFKKVYEPNWALKK